MRNGGRAIHETERRRKGTWGVEKEREKEEGEKLASFFGTVYKFLNPVPVVASILVIAPLVPVAIPAPFVPVVFVPVSSST